MSETSIIETVNSSMPTGVILIDLAAREQEVTEFAIAVAQWCDEDPTDPILNNLVTCEPGRVYSRQYWIQTQYWRTPDEWKKS